ncbi:MAG TPA: glycosyltransferase family 2 protein, partial [Vicinamibacteria bacterium]|nr:glycosyltransferase family 2 protein [Vicinamibacteria bacterium]
RRVAFAERHSWTARVAALAPRVRGLFAPASIVIVTYNNLAVTRRCLESLFACTAWPVYEVVVVDNGSSDGTVDYLRALSRGDDRVRALFGRRNLGFAPAANRGLRAARGEYLVLLNNDTVLTPGWLGGLLAHLGDPGVGAVGPVSNWASGPSQVEVEYRTLDEMGAFAARYTSAHAQDAVQTDRLAMFCLALPRSVYDEIGPLDERFELGMFEDDDYARRIRASGRRLLSVGDVFVHHVGHATFSALGAGVYDQAFAANRERFEEKWTTRWTVPGPRAGR